MKHLISFSFIYYMMKHFSCFTVKDKEHNFRQNDQIVPSNFALLFIDFNISRENNVAELPFPYFFLNVKWSWILLFIPYCIPIN